MTRSGTVSSYWSDLVKVILGGKLDHFMTAAGLPPFPASPPAQLLISW
jgi:hypothetical protein